MIKKTTIYIFFLISFFSLSFSQQTTKAVASGKWNDASTWDGGIPTSISDVIIQKGFSVEVDTYGICLAGSLSLETGASLFFNPVRNSTASLIVYGAVNLEEGSKIEIEPFEANTVVNFQVSKNINIKNASDFNIVISTSALIKLTASGLYIDKGGSFRCSILEADGDISFNVATISNKGYFEKINETLSVKKINVGGIINEGFMRFEAEDPLPSNHQKPDSPLVQRYLVLEGVYNSSYFVTVRNENYSEVPVVGLRLINVDVKRIGIWNTINKDGIPLYGLGFIGRGYPIDGTRDVVDIYNCEISESPDVGIFFSNCKRINKYWGEIGISSNVIHNCVSVGIWFMEEVEKCDVFNNKIYNIIGGNIGYGILLGMSFRDFGTPPYYPQGFANENNISKNEIYNNKIRGIYVYHSNKNLIDSNKCYGHTEEGISLKNAVKNVVILNECYGNNVNGIAVDGKMGYVTLGSKQNYIANNRCFNNGNGGLRVRYNSNENIFFNNISTSNARTGLTSHSSVGNLFVNETYKDNGWGDIYIEGEENEGYISQMWLKNCLLGSATEFVNTPEKQEFTKENSWVFSQCHDRNAGLTRIWGKFSFPDNYHRWHTNDTLMFVYDEQLYPSKSHGWNTVLRSNDTAMLRYDDGGVDGPEGSNDITSVTISSTTKTEVWIVTYNVAENKWIARGTVSGVQTNLVLHDTDFISDNGEIRFRITHRISPVSPGEEYVFATIAASDDENVQKIVHLCDFSDPHYIGAEFKTTGNAVLEISGTNTYPVVFTRKLAEDKIYTISAGTQNFYYKLSFGGNIKKIAYANFSYIDENGLELNSAPAVETEKILIARLKPSPETSYITVNNITHSFKDIVFDTYTATLGVVNYGVKATNSTLHIRSYLRPYLLDKLNNSVIYWYPTITWSDLTGFVSDGVEPNSINRFNSVEFTVKYTDLNNTPPTTIQVWVDLDDDLLFSSTEQFGLKLKPGVSNDNVFSNGEIYHYVLSNINYPAVPSLGRSGGKIKHRFFATNPYCITIATYSFSLQNVYNTILSTNEATGIAREVKTFSVKGTPPIVQLQTPIGEQTDLVRIDYVLYDFDDKPEPYNLCSVKVEYKEGNTWKEATRHDSSEPMSNLIATLNGTPHYFIWNSRKDIPNKDIPVSIRITPQDEDGTGSAAATASFQVDNIVANQLVFKTLSQELKTWTTSQVIIVEAQDELGNKDVDISGTVNLVTTSTGGAFISLNDAIITTANIVSGEVRFKYRDEIAGTPVIMVSFPGLSPAQQIFYITKNVSVVNSAVKILLSDEVSYAEIPVGSTTTVVITLKDIDNQPIANKEVILYATGSDFVITQPQSPTNTEGKIYATIYTTKAETKTITARVKDEGLLLASSATINFHPLEPSPEKSSILINKTKAIVGENISLTVKVVDRYNNPISSNVVYGNLPVRIEVENISQEDILVMLSSYTDINGIVKANFRGNTQGIKIFKGFVGSVEISTQVAVEFISGDIQPPQVVSVSPANNTLLTIPINQISVELADASGILESSTTIILYDPQNKVVSGQKTLNGNNLLYSFPILNLDGQYRIHLTACDIHGNIATYIFYFEIQTRDPQKVFTTNLLSYPNPSNVGNVFLKYSLLNDAKITIKIFNILGELVWETSYDDQEGENRAFQWFCENKDKQKVESGVYMIKIIVEDKKTGKKFDVVKKQVVIKK
ncbi:MAG: right-handed parallel beta-helix repeat-containing protein [Endomicrobia bacterium]|nr:right-handed parallel beta-helix repeat-containing protein [Endomicrobiia bacterium]